MIKVEEEAAVNKSIGGRLQEIREGCRRDRRDEHVEEVEEEEEKKEEDRRR